MLRRAIQAAACLLLLSLLGVPCWIALNRADLPAPTDGDLLELVPPDPHTDGYPALRAAAEASVFPDDAAAYGRLKSHLMRETWDGEWVEEQGRANREAFLRLEQGLTASDVWLPTRMGDGRWEDAGLVNDLMADLLSIQTLVRLSAAMARLDARREDPDGAFERALLGMRVGKKLSEAHGVNLVTMMMAAACQSISLHEVERLLRETSPGRSEAVELAERLESLRWNASAWQRTWADEYRFVRAPLLEASQQYRGDPEFWGSEEGEGVGTWLLQQLPSEFTFHPNRTLDELAGLYRELGRSGSRNCREVYAAREAYIEEFEYVLEASPRRVLETLLVPNHLGRTLVAVSYPVFSRFDMKRCHVETKVSLVQSMAALEAYRIAEGDWPDALADLAPRYLDAVPEDRFDGRPVRYAKTRGVVYSIGEDFSDDGPPEHPSQGEAAEPAISLAP